MKEVMGDLVWFIIIGILFAALGALFVRLGLLIRYGQRTDLIIKYHCDKVSEENKKAYCALAGTGVLIIGAGFFVSGVKTRAPLSPTVIRMFFKKNRCNLV